MEIRLRPELEAMIKEDVERGCYASVDEFVEQAVAQLHAQEAWLATNREEVGRQIAEGYAAAQRGELIDGDEARRRIQEIKRVRSRTTP